MHSLHVCRQSAHWLGHNNISIHVNIAFSLALHKQLVVTSKGHQNMAHGGPAMPQQNMLLGEDGLAVVVCWERQ